MMRFRLPFSLSYSWQLLSSVLIIGACIGLLLFNRLDTLLPGYNQHEIETAKSSSSFSQIIKNPVNAPFKMTVYIFSQFNDDKLLSTRLAAATFGAATIALFYIGVRHWYRRRIAFLASIMFASSAWFLHIARFGTADILFPFSILMLAVCGYWIATSRNDNKSSIAAVLALGLCVYIPGIIWFLLPALIVRWNDIARIILDLSWVYKLVLSALSIVMIIMPLTLAIIERKQFALNLLGISGQIPAPIEILRNIAAIPIKLFAWSPTDPATHLGQLPLVNIFIAVMFALGLYYYFRFRLALGRTKLLVIYFAIASILIGIEGKVNMAILLPGIFIVATAGVAALWRQWTTIFPKNPVAKSLGIFLITVAVMTSSIYNLRVYFIAWPHSQETVKSYQLTSKDLVQ